jgi:hypothetical protein
MIPYRSTSLDPWTALALHHRVQPTAPFRLDPLTQDLVQLNNYIGNGPAHETEMVR